jgi:uncharacterized membrane protein YidH (DUF202 family)
MSTAFQILRGSLPILASGVAFVWVAFYVAHTDDEVKTIRRLRLIRNILIALLVLLTLASFLVGIYSYEL